VYRFFGRHTPELLALMASTIFIGVGTYLAWFSNPAWLNRAGALVIIVGVLLAASRFQEWVQSKILGFVETNFESTAEHALLTVQSERELSLSPEEKERIKAQLKPAIHKDLAEIFEEDKRRIQAWEVWLVVLGTFLNGFGDFIISVVKPHVP
jgi:hypothetical protein